MDAGGLLKIDNLELSIIYSAASTAGLLEVIFIFQTCENAPFGAIFYAWSQANCSAIDYRTKLRSNIRLEFV